MNSLWLISWSPARVLFLVRLAGARFGGRDVLVAYGDNRVFLYVLHWL